MKPAFAMMILLVTGASAGSATQTDWSGGPGEHGPVTSWGTDFSADTDIDWHYVIGELSLACFQDYPVARVDFPRVIFPCDMDGDGYTDLLCAAQESDAVFLFRNTGMGMTWETATVAGGLDGAWTVFAADIDSDQDLDVLCTANFEGTVTWWENLDGSGSSWSGHFVTTELVFPERSVAVDVDGDSDMDVVTAEHLTGEIFWVENIDGQGLAWVLHPLPEPVPTLHVTWLEAVDIDGDCDPDIVACSSEGSICWFGNLGEGDDWQLNAITVTAWGAVCLCTADVDDDDDQDLAAALGSMTGFVLFENVDGSGSTWEQHPIISRSGANQLFPADFDGDGDVDLAACSRHRGAVEWLENSDTSPGALWAPHLLDLDQGGSAFSICAGYFFDPGILGIAVSFDNAGKVVAWSLDPTNTPVGSLQSSILDLGEAPSSAFLGWDAEEPSGTEVSFEYRCGSSPSSMGSWCPPQLNPGPVIDPMRFFQYRATLETQDLSVTPVLHDVTLVWPFTGIHGYEGHAGLTRLTGPSSNPSACPICVRFELEDDADLQLILYDMSGRVVGSIEGGFEKGDGEALFDGICPGVYMVRMVTSDYRGTCRFVVID